MSIHFETQQQKEFVLSAVYQSMIPVQSAKEVARIVEALENATVGGQCACGRDRADTDRK